MTEQMHKQSLVLMQETVGTYVSALMLLNVFLMRSRKLPRTLSCVEDEIP